MLTAEELETLRSSLERQLASLRQQIGDELAEQANERYRDLAGEVTDVQDEAVGAEIASTGNALIGHEVDEVRQIEGALERIEDGSYGVCADCGDDIDLDRLSAYPVCTRCEPCQEVHEKTYPGGRHASL
jgi:DnaK suppressor protein